MTRLVVIIIFKHFCVSYAKFHRKKPFLSIKVRKKKSGNESWRQHNKNLWDRALPSIRMTCNWISPLKNEISLIFFQRSKIRWGRWHNSVDWNWSVVEKWGDFSSSSEVDYPHKLYFALSRAAADFPPTELGQSIEKFIILLTLSAAAADGSKKSLELLAAPNNTHTSFPIRYNLMKFISILPPFLS